jgi:hypothetical protein
MRAIPGTKTPRGRQLFVLFSLYMKGVARALRCVTRIARSAGTGLSVGTYGLQIRKVSVDLYRICKDWPLIIKRYHMAL